MIDFGGQEIKGHSRSCKAEGGFKRLTEASFSTALGLVVFFYCQSYLLPKYSIHQCRNCLRTALISVRWGTTANFCRNLKEFMCVCVCVCVVLALRLDAIQTAGLQFPQVQNTNLRSLTSTLLIHHRQRYITAGWKKNSLRNLLQLLSACRRRWFH